MMEKKKVPTLKNFVAGPGFNVRSDDNDGKFSQILIDSYVESLRKNTDLLKEENPDQMATIDRVSEVLEKIIKKTIQNDSP